MILMNIFTKTTEILNLGVDLVAQALSREITSDPKGLDSFTRSTTVWLLSKVRI